jgi:mono/diheme cytochrome c family protein
MKKILVTGMIGMMAVAFMQWEDEKPVPIPASPQRTGDAAAGYRYLTTGDYIKSGIPYDFFLLAFGRTAANYLHRDSPNAVISHEYTAVRAPNGETVVAPNCLECHAQVFEGRLYVGLGNTFADFSDRKKLNPQGAAMAEKVLEHGDPAKYEAAAAFLTAMKTISGQLYTQVRGVNSADRLADLLVAHRDPQTLRWSADPVIDVSGTVVPTDVPPWWLMKKKHAMFYNGFGRGDFGRFLMASNLLTVRDSSEARQVDEHMGDVLSYIYSLNPPKYPHPIDQGLARRGGILFVEHCSKCHGHYSAYVGPSDKPSPTAFGADGEYPNLMIPESLVGTDSLLYKNNYQSPQFIEWFNRSWFAQGDHPARLAPSDGYIAPPLDGIWMTAPYLHNGSVPTLEALLDSRERPVFWVRDFANPQYDYAKVGWKYSVDTAGVATTGVYNTTLPGYGNYGHRFGDVLSAAERKAVIEYLKTL